MWESISRDTDRLKVPGGWIVRSWILYNGCAIDQIFITDPQHTWMLPVRKEPSKNDS